MERNKNLRWKPRKRHFSSPVRGLKKSAWDKIPADQRQKMLEAAQRVGAELQKATSKENMDAIAAMEKRGLQVARLTEKQKATWEKQISSAIYPLMLESKVPKEMYQQAKKLLEDFRASKKTP